jgi:hypothetical protein
MKMMMEVVFPRWEGTREVPGWPDLVAAVLGEELPATATLRRKAVALGESSSWIWEGRRGDGVLKIK